jgi:peptidoglycan hydrolase-like protein with peptidoglycan-binding domain
MKSIRSFVAGAAALAVASGIGLLPALTSAPAASAAVSCTGTSLVPGHFTHRPIRVPTVGNGTGVWECELGVGNAGPAVARLQVALDSARCELNGGLAVDGNYGPKTRQAVVDAQHFWGVPADGIYGPVTAAAMAWPIAGSNGTACDFI